MSQENKILNTVEDLKNGREVGGPGFTVREGNTKSRTLGPKVQFRTGETSDVVIAREQERLQKEVEDTRNFTEADWAEKGIAEILKVKDSYSETYKIKPNGEFDLTERPDGLAPYIKEFDTQANLFQIAKQIQDKNQEYKFNFEIDPQGQWIKYTVSKNKLVKSDKTDLTVETVDEKPIVENSTAELVQETTEEFSIPVAVDNVEIFEEETVDLTDPVLNKEEQIDTPLEEKVEKIITKPDLNSESKTTEIKINEIEQLKKDKVDLQKVREKLGLPIFEEKSEVVDQIIKEKIKIEFIKDIGKSLIRLSSALQDFEGSMIRNHFNRISFNFEELNSIALRENINFKEVNDFLDTFQTNLRKSFTTKNEANKVVSDPHYYSMALDSLDTVKANFINLRSLINRNPESKSLPDLSNLVFNLTKTISTIVRKADELDELRITLLRYKNR